MRNSLRRNNVALLLSTVVLGSTIATAPAYATDEPITDPSISTTQTEDVENDAQLEGGDAESGTTTVTVTEDGGATSGPTAVKQAYCKVTADTPHWSKGAKSVIYKTRVTCFGNIPTVRVKVTGSLRYWSGKDEHVAAKSGETRRMGTLGKTETFYTPVPSGKKVKFSAKFFGFSTGQIVSPYKGTKAKAASKTRQVNVPK